MWTNQHFDVIIIGGSYSGLSAALALGRALRRVLVIDGNAPCNRQTPHSHNFITHDGDEPATIRLQAMAQLKAYPNIFFMSDSVTDSVKANAQFTITTATGFVFTATKLIFATGIKDLLPAVPGFADCWGISLLHCPYCHGYEVRSQKTGVLGNGNRGFETAMLIANWTNALTLFTNGRSTLSAAQAKTLQAHHIDIIEQPVKRLQHESGYIQQLLCKDGGTYPLRALYYRADFIQHSLLPQKMGCAFTGEGYIEVDGMQQTSVPGVYACGDNSSATRTLAHAVSAGTTAGMMLNKALILERLLTIS